MQKTKPHTFRFRKNVVRLHKRRLSWEKEAILSKNCKESWTFLLLSSESDYDGTSYWKIDMIDD